LGSLSGRDSVRVVWRQRHFFEELHRRVVVAVPFSVLSNVPGALRRAHSSFGNDCVRSHSVAAQVALPGERLFLVLSFHSPANDSRPIDSIDAEPKVAAISFVWCYFGLEHL